MRLFRRSRLHPVWREVSRDEVEADLDRQAHQMLGMPLADVRAKHSAGVLGDSAAANYLVMASGGCAPEED